MDSKARYALAHGYFVSLLYEWLILSFSQIPYIWFQNKTGTARNAQFGE